MINLTINGKAKALEASVDLATYLTAIGVNQEHVAVGYNGEVIKKELFPAVQLRDGDVLEIVRPVGGG
ncbi:MAG: sulfur carrier protein ThiS [Dehalococcoidia bacterium]|jgi:sulfur carrier protein|nr:sulfur carrier protein ThiS [Dehalococcoidia bacterium]